MARTRWGAIVVAPSGRIGAVVFMPRSNVGPTVDTRTLIPAQDINQPETPAQKPVRAIITVLAALWAAFSAPDKAVWNTGGMKKGLSGWNRFCSYNLLQMRQGWGIQIVKNADHVAAPAAPTTLTAATYEPNLVQFTWTPVGDVGTNFEYICCGTAAGFTPSTRNCIYAEQVMGTSGRYCAVTLAAGTYYFKMLQSDTDGGVGAPGSSVGPIIVAQGSIVPPKH
jgi:hypothetical protein